MSLLAHCFVKNALTLFKLYFCHEKLDAIRSDLCGQKAVSMTYL